MFVKLHSHIMNDFVIKCLCKPANIAPHFVLKRLLHH